MGTNLNTNLTYPNYPQANGLNANTTADASAISNSSASVPLSSNDSTGDTYQFSGSTADNAVPEEPKKSHTGLLAAVGVAALAVGVGLITRGRVKAEGGTFSLFKKAAEDVGEEAAGKNVALFSGKGMGEVWNTVRHPINTFKTVFKGSKDEVAKSGETVAENVEKQGEKAAEDVKDQEVVKEEVKNDTTTPKNPEKIDKEVKQDPEKPKTQKAGANKNSRRANRRTHKGTPEKPIETTDKFGNPKVVNPDGTYDITDKNGTVIHVDDKNKKYTVTIKDGQSKTYYHSKAYEHRQNAEMKLQNATEGSKNENVINLGDGKPNVIVTPPPAQRLGLPASGESTASKNEQQIIKDNHNADDNFAEFDKKYEKEIKEERQRQNREWLESQNTPNPEKAPSYTGQEIPIFGNANAERRTPSGIILPN